MQVSLRPGKARGRATVPSSKSYAHRMVLAAALAQGGSCIRNVSPCQDIAATLDCASALGARCGTGTDPITLDGTGGRFPASAVLPCRESGSTLRFFLPVALAGGGTYQFTGTPRLFQRGVELYETMLGPTGIRFDKTTGGLTVSGRLRPGDYALPGNVSSQYVSGMLFALPLLEGDSRLTVLPPVESRNYIDITLAVLDRFGVTVEEAAPNCFRIPGKQRYRALDGTVEGDWSNGAFLLALNELGGDVRLEGLDPESLQGDRVFPALLRALDGPDPVIDLSGCPDLGPILFACAACKHGATFTGTRRLRIKESDRAAAMAEELEKFGVPVRVEENRVTVAGGLRPPTETLDGHNDHRIVMSLAVLATVTGGTITGCQAVDKSFPGFFALLEQLGLEVVSDEA